MNLLCSIFNVQLATRRIGGFMIDLIWFLLGTYFSAPLLAAQWRAWTMIYVINVQYCFYCIMGDSCCKHNADFWFTLQRELCDTPMPWQSSGSCCTGTTKYTTNHVSLSHTHTHTHTLSLALSQQLSPSFTASLSHTLSELCCFSLFSHMRAQATFHPLSILSKAICHYCKLYWQQDCWKAFV